jgi:hypothetical protein
LAGAEVRRRRKLGLDDDDVAGCADESGRAGGPSAPVPETDDAGTGSGGEGGATAAGLTETTVGGEATRSSGEVDGRNAAKATITAILAATASPTPSRLARGTPRAPVT